MSAASTKEAPDAADPAPKQVDGFPEEAFREFAKGKVGYDPLKAGAQWGFAARDATLADLRRQLAINENEITTLTTDKQKLIGALEYYSRPDHYEPWESMAGPRGPGVLTDKGRKAREALKEQKP